MPKPEYYQIVLFYEGHWNGVMECCSTEAEAEKRSAYYNDTYRPDDKRYKFAPEAVYPLPSL